MGAFLDRYVKLPFPSLPFPLSFTSYLLPPLVAFSNQTPSRRSLQLHRQILRFDEHTYDDSAINHGVRYQVRAGGARGSREAIRKGDEGPFDARSGEAGDLFHEARMNGGLNDRSADDYMMSERRDVSVIGFSGQTEKYPVPV